MRLLIGTGSDIGQLRALNEDSVFAADGIAVVADGMGGHRGGEVASRLAVDTIATADMSSIDTLVSAVQLANERVFDRARDDDTVAGMGTTVCGVAVLGDGSLGLVNVGDSRIYAYADGAVQQISIDHSFVEQLVRAGRLTKEQAASHPQKNVVTRAIGIEPSVEVDAWTLVPEEGDRLLLCSDGLCNEVSDEQIAQILGEHVAPDAAAAALIASANENGGRDNITCAVVDVIDGPASSAALVARATPHGSTGDSDLEGVNTELGVTPGGEAPEVRVASTPARGRKQRVLTWRVAAVIAVIVSVFAAAAGAIAWYAGNTFLVTDLDGEVVIYEGRPDGVLWIDPSIKPQDIRTKDLTDQAQRREVIEGVDQPSLEAATDFVNGLCTVERPCETPTTTTTTTSTTTTTVAPTTTAAPTTVASTAPAAP